MFWERKSPVCKELKGLLAVADAWIQWDYDDGTWIETVVAAMEYDTDPAGRSFRRSFLDDIERIFAAHAGAAPRRLRVVPRARALA